ncbi:MAG: type II toxin-antitoxin system HicA family toxin [Candidatus Eremiobacteraeota bacterium]|nr:type II toxin-antitoxin system HicA family toxin [Candidatus Eremiobacteraeota bacterium]MBV8204155.1 type II toxin-antitoxin system HicA family toxin [Candidatus Eremiobacteraeota bacterium]MBV8262470.1 type II toxin-antitoxin system HicA family toxin [Candidatus Eremiobacteraeota bacterium]MBV8460605.1 type II toxin-antitoxin system HicA family toxin [Candidatus Eremiobacteraeota bacterium]MBV8594705.1 type II toxin-antitoxin system HicA family toxin [Candidatus Eremiobacteraeota bacterium
MEKRLQRLYDQVARNRKNCRYEDLERLLLAAGFTLRKTSGSHMVFKRGSDILSVPKRRPVKEHYVDEALAIISKI